MHAKINKAYMMVGIIKRNFKYLTIPTLYFYTIVWSDLILIIVLLSGHHTKRRYRGSRKDSEKKLLKYYRH